MKHPALVVLLLLLSAAAFAQPAFQGFETNTGDWTDITGIPGGGITRVPSGGGVLMVPSASGNFHAEILNEPDTYQLGDGYGDYSFFGYATAPPYIGDFSQSISMYIFANWPLGPASNNGEGVWIDMQPSNPDPNNSGAEHNFRLIPTGTAVGVVVDGQLVPFVTLTTTGWYKFQMTYQKGPTPADLVTTNMNVFDNSPSPVLLGTTQVLSNSVSTDGPLFSANLMGPGYVWVTVWADGWPAAGLNDVLALDNVRADLIANTFYTTTYYSNANTAGAPDQTVRIINDGNTGANLWASIYVFDDSEELQECCACQVTPDGLLSESVNVDLTANPLTGVKPKRGVIKVISSSSTDPTNVAPAGELQEWATHVQKTAAGFSVTEGEAAPSKLSASEQTQLDSLCKFDALLSGKQCICTPEDDDF